MRRIYKAWLTVRVKVAVAMMIGCGVWFLMALNCAEEDPNMPSLVGATFAGLWSIGLCSKWS